ncbi:hypothetical protein [Pseudomonas sp. WS 5071]|uniref:hypothetical protein n=1 Tax=Pseudomonas sp. WS 5071 TaxID=2717479 RepID=UPI001474A532|nr:hypothetical protein [Pseudomonas sp. WS 5071]NMY74454.1 hypothetical protein [Pseudomonas sp. WS 5071]
MERQELHRRYLLLKEMVSSGKFHVAEHLKAQFQESFRRIKTLPDGMVDPDSIDGFIRSSLSAMAYMADRQEWKELVSLKDIQAAYFNRVHDAFGVPYEMMRKAEVDPYKFSAWFASDEIRVNENIEIIDEFTTEIIKFWTNISEPTWIHLEDSIDTKAIFTGELFPDGYSNLASSTGIYFDTTILPDPFVKISSLFAVMPQQERVEEVLRLALQVLQYKDIALLDLDKPIIAILPDRHRLDENYGKYINLCAEQDTINYGNTLFDQNFSDPKELLEYLRSIKDPKKFSEIVKDPKRLSFSTEWDGSYENHISRYIQENQQKLGAISPGDAVFINMFSRFSQANNSLQRSSSLHGTPVIRAETSWLWFNIMLKENSKAYDDQGLKNLHISRALQTTVKNEISWLGEVPIDALIEIRKNDALEEIRSLLGTGISDIIDARPNNFFRTGDHVLNNIQEAFEKHEAKIKELRGKQWKFAGRDIGSFVVVGGIELAAAITGIPAYGAIATAANLTGVIPSMKDLKEKFNFIKQEKSDLTNTGVGILFKSRK